MPLPAPRLAKLLLAAATLLAAPRLHAQPAAPPSPGVLLFGTVVPMDGPPFVGWLWIRDSVITAMGRGTAIPRGARHAHRIDTGGAIYPGLIDAHNHPMHGFFPLWHVSRRFANRYEWRRQEPTYHTDISTVYYRLADTAGVAGEIGLWAKMRGLAGGTVALQGWELPQHGDRTKLRRGVGKFHGELARTVEDSNFGLPWTGGVAIDLPIDADLRAHHDSLHAVAPWLVHLAEGQASDTESKGEFQRLFALDAASRGLRVIHGAAGDAAAFKRLAAQGSQLVWSPLSNGLLYGETTPVDLAKAAGVRISLGSDWGPSGTKNLLGELKVADAWNKSHHTVFSDRELALMVTRNPAAALGWSEHAGRLAPGLAADLVVLDRTRRNVYRNLIDATERNVRLVLVSGRPLYGDANALRRALKAEVEPVGTVGGRAKALALPAHRPDGTRRPTLAETRAVLVQAIAAVPAPGAHLDSLFTESDSAFFAALRTNPNAPPWIRTIEAAYRSRRPAR